MYVNRFAGRAWISHGATESAPVQAPQVAAGVDADRFSAAIGTPDENLTARVAAARSFQCRPERTARTRRSEQPARATSWATMPRRRPNDRDHHELTSPQERHTGFAAQCDLRSTWSTCKNFRSLSGVVWR